MFKGVVVDFDVDNFKIYFKDLSGHILDSIDCESAFNEKILHKLKISKRFADNARILNKQTEVIDISI